MSSRIGTTPTVRTPTTEPVSTRPSEPVAPTTTSRTDTAWTGRPLRPPRDPFQPPSYEIEVRNGVTRPGPNDVTVKKGFDGLTPEQAAAAVRSHLKSPIDPSKEALLKNQIIQQHKTFTLAVSNAFIPGSPLHNFINDNQPESVKVHGTLSATNPVVIEMKMPGEEPRFYKPNGHGGYDRAEAPKQVILEAGVRLNPAGVAMRYPDFTAPQLAP
jgi:hypothetical protein